MGNAHFVQMCPPAGRVRSFGGKQLCNYGLLFGRKIGIKCAP